MANRARANVPQPEPKVKSPALDNHRREIRRSETNSHVAFDKVVDSLRVD